MPTLFACPGLSSFERLAGGHLPDTEQDALLVHLETCPHCAQRVSTLPQGDALADLVRHADRHAQDPVLASVGNLVEKVRQLRPTPSEQTQTTNLRAAWVSFACAQCGKRIKIKGQSAGKALKCPHCLYAIRVPKSATAVPQNTVALSANPVGQDTLSPAKADHADLHDLLAPPQRSDELGRLGPYRVIEILGSGGMGVVFKAEDPKLQRVVAVKAMLPGLAADRSAKERFFREARAAASIKHDNVVTIHQVDEDRGIPFLAMEFLEGQSLAGRLASGPKLPPKEVLRIAREIAAGLAAAHAQGLVHRDIKPANIWLEAPNQRVKILDFGLARASGGDSQLTEKGILMGTPAYMCPEQASGRVPDARGDLFSLGCVLYAMCAGGLPFRGTDPISTLVAVVSFAPEHIHKVDASLPPDFADLIMQLLEKKPEDRPPSAQAVAQRVAQMESGKRARRLPRSTPSAGILQSRRGLSFGAFAAFFLIATAVFGLSLLVWLTWPSAAKSDKEPLSTEKGSAAATPSSAKETFDTLAPPKGQDKKGYGPKGPPPNFPPPPPQGGKKGEFDEGMPGAPPGGKGRKK